MDTGFKDIQVKNPVPREVARKTIKKLERLGILMGWESRPDATLSPYAVERPWNFSITVKHGRNHWQLSGDQTSYGRGLNIQQDRISCVMEHTELRKFLQLSRMYGRGACEKNEQSSQFQNISFCIQPLGGIYTSLRQA